MWSARFFLILAIGLKASLPAQIDFNSCRVIYSYIYKLGALVWLAFALNDICETRQTTGYDFKMNNFVFHRQDWGAIVLIDERFKLLTWGRSGTQCCHGNRSVELIFWSTISRIVLQRNKRF